MGMPDATRLAAATGIKNLGAHVSLHTGAGGGTTGANEASGGGYARQLTTWTSGTTGYSGSPVTIACAAGTYTEGGIWSASTGGTFVGSQAFSGGSVVVSGAGASIVVTPSISA